MCVEGDGVCLCVVVDAHVSVVFVFACVCFPVSLCSWAWGGKCVVCVDECVVQSG